MPHYGLTATRREAFCPRFAACGPDFQRRQGGAPGRTGPHMTFHDILHTPLPVISTERQRAEGPRRDLEDRNPETGDATPPLRRPAGGSGRNDGKGWSRPGRSIWETMLKSEKMCRTARPKMADFRQKRGNGASLATKKNY